MNCKEFEHCLEPLLAGKLRGEEARQVRQHVRDCPRCRTALSPADRIEILPLLDGEIEPREDLDGRFRARLAAHRADRTTADASSFAISFGQSWFAPGRIAALGALAAFLFLGVYLGLYQVPAPGPVSTSGEMSIAENLPLLQNMGVIKNLDMLEDFDAIEEISQEEPEPIPVK